MHNVLVSKSPSYLSSLMPSEYQRECWCSFDERNRHIDLIFTTIETAADVQYYVNAMVARFSGQKITALDVLNRPELFTIRVMANRRVIDAEKFHPTTSEMDEALLRVVDCVLRRTGNGV